MKLYYKGTNRNLCCKGFQYEVGKTYKVDNPCICERGFHACEEPEHVFKFGLWRRFLIVTGKVYSKDYDKVCFSEMTILREVDVISFFSKEKPEEFDWAKFSWCIAVMLPNKFDPDKYNWEKHSWAVAQHCPDKLDPDRYNWEIDSWAVAQCCPDKLDPDRYNWEKYSWLVAQYCPDKLDPNKYNWKVDSGAVAQHCPDKLKLRSKMKLYYKVVGIGIAGIILFGLFT